MALHVFLASVQFLMLLLFFDGANSFEKPGTCPETSGGICVLECESDDVCPGEEKCCYNGCGHTCQRPEKPECPELKCDLDCTEFGYKVDSNGCALCECFVDQCPMINCVPCPKYYNYTLIDGHICRGCNCVDSVQCPPLGCVCPEGYKQDTAMDGCPVCRCVQEEPICPELNCDLDCTESGYKLDDNGCRTCECYRNLCPMVHCLPCPKYYNYEVIEGHTCRGCDCVDTVQCPALGCECPEGYKQDTGRDGCPVCRCVPEEPICPELNCDLDCSDFGYKLDDNGCAMCECYRDPCPMIGCSMPCAEYYNYTNISGNICRGCECVSSIDCPQLHCECPEEYKLDTDINGCPTCRCVSQGRRDQDDLGCPMRLCVQNCPSGYEKDDQGCQTCKCLEPRCPELNCGLDCTESGYKLDNNGCAVCECFVNQCPMIDCVPCPKYYNYEVIDGNMCRGCNCVDSVECPALGCECPEGYKPDTGMDGCPVCRCVPEEPICPELNCNLDCTESGYKLDNNGCAVCECFVNQCPMIDCVPCPKYYNYEVIDGNMCRGCNCVDSVECPALGCECPEGYKQDTGRDGCPVCRCVPEEPICPELNCDLNCNESGYKLDDNGCAMCECYRDPCPMGRCRGCPEYYNYTNIEGNICQSCHCVSSVQCPELQCGCLEGTTHDTDINGCPTCRCVSRASVSRARRVQADLGCPMKLCAQNCPSGYEKDDQGCQTCKCLSTWDNYYIFIIVGCLVALLIVCGIIGIVLYRRRGKKNKSVSSDGIVKEPLNEKYLAVPAVDMSIGDVKNPNV